MQEAVARLRQEMATDAASRSCPRTEAATLSAEEEAADADAEERATEPEEEEEMADALGEGDENSTWTSNAPAEGATSLYGDDTPARWLKTTSRDLEVAAAATPASASRGRGRDRFARFRECETADDFAARVADLATAAAVTELHAFYLQHVLPVLDSKSPVDVRGVDRVEKFDANVVAFADRVVFLRSTLKASLPFVSHPCVGKTSEVSIASRFSNHKQKVKGLNASLLMLATGRIADEDVPPHVRTNRFRGVDLTLKYEEAVVEALKARGVRLFDDAGIGGGGRANLMDGDGILYAVFVVSKDPAFDMDRVRRNLSRAKAARTGVGEQR